LGGKGVGWICTAVQKRQRAGAVHDASRCSNGPPAKRRFLACDQPGDVFSNLEPQRR
jgi:hypothetical protein